MRLLHLLPLATAFLASAGVVRRTEANLNVRASDALPTDVTIFTPPANYQIPRTLYARTLLLNKHCETDGVILATWENYSPNGTKPWFPIYESRDLGFTWNEISRVEDTVNGWGLRYQPFLYELPIAIGNYPAGTILCAGNSIPDDLSQTKIDVYASADQGLTWEFVSSVASGGVALPNNGETPVWEPFLMVYQGQLIMYYSDQRDPDHGQKLVHQVSSDLLNWGEIVDDVAYDTYDFRPGMTTVSELPGGQYILTYEFYGAPEVDFAVYYRISDNPLTFNDIEGQVLTSADGTTPDGSPYNVYTPEGGPQGTIVVSAGSNTELFLNDALGAPDAWVKVATPESRSYTRSVMVMPGQQDIMIAGGGVLSGTNNSVTESVVSVATGECLPADQAPPFAECNEQYK